MNAFTKVICYGGLLLLWGFFAFIGKTPVEGFIQAIQAALIALGAVHVMGSAPKKDEPAPRQ